MKDGCWEVRGVNFEFKFFCIWVRWVLIVLIKCFFEYLVCWIVDDVLIGDMVIWVLIDVRLWVIVFVCCCKLRSLDVGGFLLKRGLLVIILGVFFEVKFCRIKEL